MKGDNHMDNMIIDRETYRTIKKMSREELQAFLISHLCNITLPRIQPHYISSNP